jgi:hypothetical protein
MIFDDFLAAYQIHGSGEKDATTRRGIRRRIIATGRGKWGRKKKKGRDEERHASRKNAERRTNSSLSGQCGVQGRAPKTQDVLLPPGPVWAGCALCQIR